MISIHCVRVNLVSARFLLNCRLSFCRMARRVSYVSFYYLEWFECIVQWDVNLKEEEKRTYQRVNWQTLKVGQMNHISEFSALFACVAFSVNETQLNS